MIIEGKIIRKKKRPTSLVLSVKPEDHVSTAVHVDLNHTYNFLFLYSIVRVQFYQEGDDILAREIELLQCSPTPTMIPLVLQGIVEGRFAPSVIPDWTVEEAKRIIDMPVGRKKRISIAEISRILEGRGAYKPPRSRMPFVKRREYNILEELQRVGATGERGWTIRTIETREYDDNGNNKDEVITDFWENAPLNIPESPNPLPDRGPRPTREEYILNKKIPQVRWMVHRVLDLYTGKEPPKHILDVGGGRGDLATSLALALPSSHLTVVDVNQPSLDAGKEYAQARGCGNQIDFVLADMVDYVAQENLPEIDLIVALHACGDLSDLAFRFASKIKAAFVICPCCYAKRKITEFEPAWESLCDQQTQLTLRRLSELNEKPEVSRLSMKLINSMRYHRIQEDHYCVSLEQYDIAKSTRNHVFIGTIK